MAIMAGVLKQALARSAEAKLRFEGSAAQTGSGWMSMTTDTLARWLFDQRIPGSIYTYIQYRNIARDVIRNARDAATMNANPSMTILNLGTAPGVPPNFPAFEYRTVVVGRAPNGEELWSTLHYVYSHSELNALQVQAEALQQYQQPLIPPGFPPPPMTIQQSASTIEVYLVSAGRR
jgi:hypothetical protein